MVTLLAAALLACGRDRPAGPAATLELVANEGMRLAQADMRGVARPTAWCLTPARNARRPAPPDLLRRLAKGSVPVYDAADCTFDTTSSEYATADGHRAWLLWVTPLQDTDTLALVRTGYHAGPLLAAEWTCSVRNAQTPSPSIACRMDWIS